MYVAVFLMRFSFAFTVVAIQYIVPFPFERGIISATYPLMEMLTGVLFGILADKAGRKWIVSVALFSSSAITLSFTLTRDFLALTLIHGLQGICAAAIITCTLASLTDIGKQETRGREMGMYDFCTIGGYGMGFVFSLLIISGDVSRALIPFYVGSAVAFLAAVYCAIFLEDRKLNLTSRISLKLILSNAISNRKSISLLATWFVLTVLIGVGLTYTRELLSAITLPRSLGPGGGAVSIFNHASRFEIIIAPLLVTAIILLAFTQTGLGSLADLYGRPRLVLLGEISIFGILVTLVLMFQLRNYDLIAIPFLLIFGAGLLAFTPAGLAELADIAPLSGRGSTMGLYSVTVGAGTVFAPLAGGLLLSKYGIDLGFSILFLIGIAIMLGVLLSRLSEKRRST